MCKVSGMGGGRGKLTLALRVDLQSWRTDMRDREVKSS